MRNTRVARRYAVALMDAAVEQNAVEAVAADMKKLGALLTESRELSLFIVSPIIQAAKKKSVLREVLKSLVGKEVLTFCLLLASKGREEHLPVIVEQFTGLYNERLGIVDVDVSAATPLGDDQQEKLRKELEQYTSRKVLLKAGVDKDLRGGLLIQIGDTVLDGSVRHQLERLKDRFVAGGTLS
ncbi:MAG: ATP synthase F1 subunit delta [Ignavibacteria bacterium]|nr:ATP synthase F1 subunit delta [Ignavibacteria bacterium]